MQKVNIGDKFFTNEFFLVGIGGISMSGIAKYLLKMGCKVEGSDTSTNEQTEELKRLGVHIYNSHLAENIKEQTIIYSDSIPFENAELVESRKRGLSIFRRIEFLSLISKDFKKVIAISGTHGKTSTTAMLSHILYESGEKFTCFIGGEDLVLGNFYSNGTDYLVMEACEYKKNLLSIKADIGVVLNIELDHIDCYADIYDLENTFIQFGNLCSKVFVDNKFKILFDDYKKVIVVDGENYLEKQEKNNERYSFIFNKNRYKLNVFGEHNVSNCLFAIAVSKELGIDDLSIKKGIENFKGVKRRGEVLGYKDGVCFMSDYAHHPTEIEKTLSFAKKICKNKLVVVFQSHTYSRTIHFLNEFASCLSKADLVGIYKTYGAREKFKKEGSGKSLASLISNAMFLEDVESICKFIKDNTTKGDLVLFLGAGDVDSIGRNIFLNNY